MVSIAEANELGKDMIDQHLHGKGWRLTWDRAQNRAGAANFRYREIILSTVAVEKYSWDTFQDLMLHEIAHVLTQHEEKDHGPDWRRTYKKLGGSGEKYCKQFAATDHVEITLPGLVGIGAAVYAVYLTVGLGWALVAAGVVLWWAVARIRRSLRPAAQEHGLVMVDGKWIPGTSVQKK